MSPDIVWAGWLGLFLVYEVAAALRERGTDQRLTLSRQVWAWFDKAFERVALGVFLLVLTAHLVFGRPGGLAVILTAAPVALVILVALVRRPAAPRPPTTWGRLAVLLALPLLLANGPGGCNVELPWPPKPTPSPEPSPTPPAAPTPSPGPTPTPEPTPAPTPAPTPGPTPTPGSACSLGTPRFDNVPGVRFRIYADGLGFGVTPLARFGADYCARAGWTDGRSECAAAPDGHPARVACERQFLALECPRFLHHECLGTGQQCPVTFDPYFFNKDTGQDEPFPANVAADCPRDPQDSTDVRAYKVTASGKGRFKVCTGAPPGVEPVCTVGPEIDR